MGSDYWSGLLDWVKEVMLKKYSYISPEDLDVFSVVDDPKETARILVDFRKANGISGLQEPTGIKKTTMPF
jgi:predicted Rossmann-fold nucleotide-binding protein